MSDYTEHAAIGRDEARSEVEREEEPAEVPSLLKDLDEVDLHDFGDEEVEDLLHKEFATNIEDVQGTVLTDGEETEPVEKADSYTDLVALAEHDPDVVDPDEVALQKLREKAVTTGLVEDVEDDFGGGVVIDAIERATEDVRSSDTTDREHLIRESVAHATEMATSKIEAAEYAGDYVLKVTDDEETAVKARKEALEGYGKARQYVSDPTEAPDDVNCKEGPNGSLYYDPSDRGRGNNEATGPVENDLLEMDREELSKAMEVDPNDPDASLQDAKREARAEKAVRTLAEKFDVEVGRVERFFKDARERGVTDAESLVRHAKVVFGKVEDPDEIEDPDDDGEEELDIEGDPDEIEDPDDDGEEEVDFEPDLDNPDEKDEDPCWDGYTQVGMKEGEDGEKVPNCVPEEEAKAVDEETLKGRRYVQDPEEAPDDVEVQEGNQGGYYYETGGGEEDQETDETDSEGEAVDVADEDVDAAMDVAVDMIRQPESYDHVDPDGREDMADHAAAVVADSEEEVDAIKDEVVNEMIEEEIGTEGLQMVIDEADRSGSVEEAIESEAEFLADTYGYPQDAVEDYLEDRAADYADLDYDGDGGDSEGGDEGGDEDTGGSESPEGGDDVPEAVEEQGFGPEWEEYEGEPQARADMMIDALGETGELDMLQDEAVVETDADPEELIEPILDDNGVPEGEAREYITDELVGWVEQAREENPEDEPMGYEEFSAAEDVIDEGIRRAFEGGGREN